MALLLVVCLIIQCAMPIGAVADAEAGDCLHWEKLSADKVSTELTQTGLTAEEIRKVLPQLNATKRYSGRLAAQNLYDTAKLPFNFNYVDKDLDVSHDNDTQGGHGSHVAGIAAANYYVPGKNGTYAVAKDTVYAVGQAPDAQIISMKVAGKGGGIFDSDYMAALEDAIMLGCDVVNMSFGSSNIGNTYSGNEYYDALYDSLQGTGLVLVNTKLILGGKSIRMLGGEIHNVTSTDSYGAVIFAQSSGTITIDGGKIYNNSANNIIGGAKLNVVISNGAHLIGGRGKDGDAQSMGYIYGDSRLLINGGEIKGFGGSSNVFWVRERGRVTVNGGYFHDNHANYILNSEDLGKLYAPSFDLELDQWSNYIMIQ